MSEFENFEEHESLKNFMSADSCKKYPKIFGYWYELNDLSLIDNCFGNGLLAVNIDEMNEFDLDEVNKKLNHFDKFKIDEYLNINTGILNHFNLNFCIDKLYKTNFELNYSFNHYFNFYRNESEFWLVAVTTGYKNNQIDYANDFVCNKIKQIQKISEFERHSLVEKVLNNIFHKNYKIKEKVEIINNYFKEENKVIKVGTLSSRYKV